jgi:hypothetical protein
VEINERFALVLRTARELLSDFRSVEENFKRIARDIAEQHAVPGITKGTIVGNMLTSHDSLRQSDQGQSFFAFWDLLIAEDKREHFERTLEKVLALSELDEGLRSQRLLRRLVSQLLVEGEKVVSSHQRMSANLRRVLDTTTMQDRRRVLDLIHDIQRLALSTRAQPPAEEDFFQLEEMPALFSGMSRPFWRASEGALFSGPIEEADVELGLDELRRFRNLPQIRLEELRKNIDQCLTRRQTTTLEQVLEEFPPRNGVMEVLGYLVVASREPRHFISSELRPIKVSVEPPQRWRLPIVMFCRE